jgi:phosphate:Na+ symporter
MYKKILYPVILVILAFGFWISPDFKNVSAGLAVFLGGMVLLEMGFSSTSEGNLKRIVTKFTDKLPKSIGFGFITTAMVQSSSLISVIAISFISAELISLTQGVGIILGANIGTTTGAWLMAAFGFKIHIAELANWFVFFGFILSMKSKNYKSLGFILLGIGTLFYGIDFMKSGFESVKQSIDLSVYTGHGLKYVFIFILAGILATFVMQSSHATIFLTLSLLMSGVIFYDNAIAIVIGANIGTTITAFLASLSSKIAGKRLAAAHFIFNIVTAIIAVVLLDQIMSVVTFIADYLGIAKDNNMLRLAVFDSFFKIMGVIIFIPFVGVLVNFLEKIFKDSKKTDDTVDNIRYLDDAALELPITALQAIVLESIHLYENVFSNIAHGLNLKKSNIKSDTPLETIIFEPYSDFKLDMDKFYEKNIKNIFGQILSFSTKAQSKMESEDIGKLFKLKLANRDMVDAVKDTKHLQKNIIKYSDKRNNESMYLEYNAFKIQIADILRNIEKIRVLGSDNEDEILLYLSQIKTHIEKDTILNNGTLDNLIRNDKITPDMAASLIKDSDYVASISKHLLTMAEILFIDDELTEMLFNDDDVNDVLNNTKGV